MIRQIWFQNLQNIEQIKSSQKTKKAQNVVFNLKGRISDCWARESSDILFKTILFCIL
jgi:hypothetical protein